MHLFPTQSVDFRITFHLLWSFFPTKNEEVEKGSGCAVCTIACTWLTPMLWVFLSQTTGGETGLAAFCPGVHRSTGTSCDARRAAEAAEALKETHLAAES